MSRDPITYEGSKWNLYEFVNGNSLVRTDPFGLGWRECILALLKDLPSAPLPKGSPPSVTELETLFRWLQRNHPHLLQDVKDCFKGDGLGGAVVTAEKGVQQRNIQKRQNQGRKNPGRQRGRGGRGRGRRGSAKPGLIGKLCLIEAEAACVLIYHGCLDGARENYDTCAERAHKFADPKIARDYLDNCLKIFYADAAECATEYAVCGLSVLLPF